jgi:hypothetical protein
VGRRLALIALITGIVLCAANMRAASGTYQEVKDWAKLPPGAQWGVMSAVDIDSHGTVYAFQRDPSKVMVFGPEGNFLKEWGANEFPAAHGLNFLRDGSLWLTDRKIQQAIKFSPDGKILMTLGTKGVAGDHNSTTGFDGPAQIVMGKGGELFVADGEGPNARVVKFSREGKFVKFWGSKGDGPGELDNVHCIAMDSKGLLYVCNRANKRIEVFDQDGKYITQMAQFGAPASIFITKDDTIYVAAGAPENRITIGTTGGKIMEKIEGFRAPHMIAVDVRGNLYVAEVAGKSLRKFVRGSM